MLVGFLVGFFVGFDVGFFVGFLVGLGVGFFVGLTVGNFVGLTVGDRVEGAAVTGFGLQIVNPQIITATAAAAKNKYRHLAPRLFSLMFYFIIPEKLLGMTESILEVCAYFLVFWGACVFIIPSIFDYPIFLLLLLRLLLHGFRPA